GALLDIPIGDPLRRAIPADRHFADILDTAAFRSLEIRIDVLAGGVLADAPTDRAPVGLHPLGAAHHRIDILHREGDVVEAVALAAEEGERMMIRVASEEALSPPDNVDDLEAEGVADER